MATAGTEPVPIAASGAGSVEEIARLIFAEYLWAFEPTGALLITATLGAVVLAHRERFGPKRTQRGVDRAFRRGGNSTPLPNPGVYARHNAADTPARLPDGTLAKLSVPGHVITKKVDTAGTRPEQVHS